MSREQSDQVALANDGLDAKPRFRLMQPLTDTFIRNAIASGAITPPYNENRLGRYTGLIVLAFMLLGAIFMWLGATWK